MQRQEGCEQGIAVLPPAGTGGAMGAPQIGLPLPRSLEGCWSSYWGVLGSFFRGNNVFRQMYPCLSGHLGVTLLIYLQLQFGGKAVEVWGCPSLT